MNAKPELPNAPLNKRKGSPFSWGRAWAGLEGARCLAAREARGLAQRVAWPRKVRAAGVDLRGRKRTAPASGIRGLLRLRRLARSLLPRNGSQIECFLTRSRAYTRDVRSASPPRLATLLTGVPRNVRHCRSLWRRAYAETLRMGSAAGRAGAVSLHRAPGNFVVEDSGYHDFRSVFLFENCD